MFEGRSVAVSEIAAVYFCVTIVEDDVYFYGEPMYVKVLANFLCTSLHSYNTVFATKLNMGKNTTNALNSLVANRNVMAVTAGSNMLISLSNCVSHKTQYPRFSPT